ncbi:N-acetyltransferase family protein [Sulfitobacter sp. PS-8MA]|uniref:N-acetyltransferase family protein n=1 Tax=Sulfitobacter sp. PS-8MA TaxID=3237707 RepID=UPI0034C5CE22
MIHIRRAGTLDTRAMAELLNAIIAKGGTTAMTAPVTPRELQGWMAAPDSAWHLAEDSSGSLKGFQYIEPHPDLPEGGVDVATFVRLGETGLGIGSALFEQTKQAARALGYRHIHAIIRADNAGGLAYYQSRGFEDFKRLPNSKLADGSRVDRIWKRFEL